MPGFRHTGQHLAATEEGAREVHPDNIIPFGKRHMAESDTLIVWTFRRVASIADKRGYRSPPLADIGEEPADAAFVTEVDRVGVDIPSWKTGA